MSEHNNKDKVEENSDNKATKVDHNKVINDELSKTNVFADMQKVINSSNSFVIHYLILVILVHL
jgi:hypothetical protein